MSKYTESMPIFILGSPRSGTSILTAAIKRGGGIPGFNEGHFLPLLGPLIENSERFFEGKRHLMQDERHMIAHIDRKSIEREIIEIFKRHSEKLLTKPVWIDKSPGSAMIKAVPSLVEAWPRGRFVFAKRRGIENVISRLKKFPHVDFSGHCKGWASCMDAWLSVRERLSSRSIEIDQRDIGISPDDTAGRLCRFLALHDEAIESIAGMFKKNRPQFTGGVEEEQAIDMRETGWSEEQIEKFRYYCADVSAKFGYTETSQYRE